MNKPTIFQKSDYLLAAAMTLLFLLLYGKTLAPGLLTGDSAEFQVLSQQLGLTHAMGYPIYLLVGKLFSYLPINELPWRINLLSAVSASLAIGILYLMARVFTRHKLIALSAPVAFGLTGIFWRNSIIAEVYSTSNLVSNLILIFLLLWEKKRDSRFLVVAGFLGGIGLGIHSMIVLLSLATIVYMAVNHPSRREWLSATIGTISGVAILLLTYFWLAVRDPAAANIQSVILPNISRYGLTPADLDSPWERMLFIMTARQFSGTLFSLPFLQVMTYIKTYFVSLIQAVGFLWVGLGLVGLVTIFFRLRMSSLDGEKAFYLQSGC